MVRRPVAYGAFNPNGTYETAYVYADQLAIQRQTLQRISIQPGLDLLVTLNGYVMRKNDTATIFAQALTNYGHALEATSWQDAFLSLWHVLEMITHRPHARYSNMDVVKRAQKLCRASPVMSDFLEICAENRDDLVHRGQFSSDGQSEVLLLKSAARRCLEQLLADISSVPTRDDLDQFFRI